MLELRDYQDEISTKGALLLEKYKMCYLAMECRTGKTLTALAVALKYGAKSVLVISKKRLCQVSMQTMTKCSLHIHWMPSTMSRAER